MEEQVIIDKIRESLPDAKVQLKDLTGTKDHWEATVVSAAFDTMSRMQRHRVVHDALSEELKGPIHALTLTLLTPDQALKRE